MTLPKTMADALNRYENEQRAIDYVVLDRAKAGDVAAPTLEVIAKYFEDHKAEFRAPEYRTIVVMSVAPIDLAKPADVSDVDAKRYYDNNLTRFGAPEGSTRPMTIFAEYDLPVPCSPRNVRIGWGRSGMNDATSHATSR